MNKTKMSAKFWIALTVFSLIGQVAWVVENMYFNVFIYKMFNASAAQISLMVSASQSSSFIPKQNIFLAALLAAVAIWFLLVFVFKMLKKEK